MKFISTRGKDFANSSQEAVLRGLARDGGLYVPQDLPKFEMGKLAGKSYAEMAAYIIGLILDDFEGEDLLEMARAAYDDRFYVKDALRLINFEDKKKTVVELFHGPTAAFKDFALTMLPRFMAGSMRGQEVIILTATSGDTGKAALEGFKDVEGTSVFVYYPTDGVSPMQKRQMMTQEGKNTHAIAIEGNFDHAQRGVKEIFSDEEMAHWAQDRGAVLSSANSINIGRLVPQVVYYIYSYEKLVEEGIIKRGDQINVSVPTGNFGDILGAYYAKTMGLPIHHLICASNENKVLTDFFRTGVYDANRDLKLTQSPSMDILVSSNLERLLYHVTGEADQVAAWMADLKEGGRFEVGQDVLSALGSIKAYHGDDESGRDLIRSVFEEEAYLLDTHTAMAWKAHEDYLEETGKGYHTLVMATASPFKFPGAVAQALGLGEDLEGEALLESLSQATKTPIPDPLRGLWQRPLTQDRLISIEDMAKAIKESF
ncbi:MAG: threonine synthase [Tissierellia bacterium]|nr:threonine synthase [Tissierellia bacterium]